MKKLIIILVLLFGSTAQLFSQTVNGEIISDTNNVITIKIWGTSEERGFAYGYLVGDKFIEVLEDFIIPFFGNDWPNLKDIVTEGISFHIDSVYWNEAQAMMDGATVAGYNPHAYAAVDLLAANLINDVYAWPRLSKTKYGFHCSAFMNWGDATAGTDLNGCSVISRHMDAYVVPVLISNVIIVVHIPSEPNKQPWLLIGCTGEMAPASGINSSGLSIFANGITHNWSYSTNAGYEPYAFTFRKALESADYNQDGVNNMLDIRDAISSNSQGYAWGSNFSASAPSTAIYDSLIAMVAEVCPEEPYITFRTNSYNDTLPGDNLYAANSEIKRNNLRHYCNRYLAIVDNIGDGTGIGSQENWDLMKNYSNGGVSNMQFMQYIPEWSQLNLSVYRDGTPAYMHDPVSYDVNNLFTLHTLQAINLFNGYQFISSGIIPENPDMTIVMADVLNDNLDFVRNSQGEVLRKIGLNWVNGIGDWIVDEGYLVKMFADDLFTINGTLVDPATPIPVITGYQFVSYFPENAMEALLAFETIIGDDLDFIRNSQGGMLRKIGPNWVNGIGDALPTEGYLVKMFAAGEIIYPAAAKSSGKITAIPTHFIFEGGNAADPVYTIYIDGLEIGNEVAAYDGDIQVGAMKVNSQNIFENELAVFSTLVIGQGYEAGNPITLKVWSENNIVSTDFTMEAIYDSYVSDVYPEEDGKYSIVNITKGSIDKMEETISVFPNPSDGIFNVLLEGVKDDIQIKVLDLIGKEYSNFELNGSASTQLDLTELAAGVYFISFSCKDFSQVKKIVKQ